MHKLLFPSGLLLALMLLPAAAGAEIYKSVDENGNVVFSDQPSPGAEQIEKKQVPTVPATVPDVDLDDSGEGEQQEQAGDAYSLRIASPEHDSAVRENAGNITVNIALEPTLRLGHEVVLYLDGEEAARGSMSSFSLANVDRGTHSLTAVVLDGGGNEVARSDSIEFTMQRRSRLQNSPNNPAPNTSAPEGTPTNPPDGSSSGQNPITPSNPGPTPTNPPRPSAR